MRALAITGNFHVASHALQQIEYTHRNIFRILSLNEMTSKWQFTCDTVKKSHELNCSQISSCSDHCNRPSFLNRQLQNYLEDTTISQEY